MRIRLEQFRQARRIHGGTLNMLGAAIGVRLSRIPIPSARLRRKVFSMLYGGKYDALDEAELETPLEDFPTINALFTRGVKPELRPVPERSDQFLSPVDGTVQDHGQIQHDTIMTVKGIRYTLNSMCPETDIAPYLNGQFAILFLSPRDCHRVYAPAEGVLERMVHVPGHRLLVHPPYQRPEFPVFALNERLIMQFDTVFGRCLVVMVAGWGVGHITHPFSIARRISPRRVSVTPIEPSRIVARNEWVATFELGSTVILITERGRTMPPLFSNDQKILLGQPLYDAAPCDCASASEETCEP